MRDWLYQQYGNNTVLAYLWCAGILFLFLLFRRYVAKYVAGLFFKLFKKSAIKVDQQTFVNLLVDPLDDFLLVVVVLVTLDRLRFPQVLNVDVIGVTAKQILHALGTILLIFTFIRMLVRMIDFAAVVIKRKTDATPETSDDQMLVFFKDFFKVLLVILGVLLVIRFAFHKNIGTLLAGLSIVAGALALAARESLENLIASFIIFFDKPFHVGEMVKVQQITGTIERIGLRSTRIRTDQKTYVTVPNKQMVDSIMDNLSNRTQRRADLKLELDLGTSPTQLEALVTAIRAVLNHPQVESAQVYFQDIQAKGYIIAVEYYTGMIPIQDFFALKQELNLQILQVLDTQGVKLSDYFNCSDNSLSG
jgi:MscS family membrane protein